MPDQSVDVAVARSTAQDAVPSPQPPVTGSAPAVLVEADLLVEDVSIDGMCGVY